MSPVIAVVATYRPDAQSLLALLADLAGEAVPTIVVDDASPCTFDPLLRQVSELVAGDGPVQVQRFDNNRGVARSLNIGLALAKDQHAPWLLTLDQDTRLPAGVIEKLLATAARAKKAGLAVGAVGPIVVDTGGG
ncbi:MAG: glycosyltransferase, partial [Actinomycetota bacterium]|nr:glycosyltransferase [Actinomycetota bacterium]